MRQIWRVAPVVIMLCSFVVFTPASPVQAAGVVGDGTPGSCDEGALDTALAGGGLVTFDCHPSDLPIVVTSEKEISVNTQISGGGAVTLSGGEATRIFLVNGGISLDLLGITVIDGNGVGASSGFGGAIRNSGSLTLTDSTVSGSSASFGGGVYNNSGTIMLTDSTVSGSSASFGGGIYNSGTLTLTNSTLSGNTAPSGGGGIYNNVGTLILADSTVSGNTTSIDGGGIYNNSAAVTVTDSTVSGNSATSDGGGIFNGGTATLTNSTLFDNSADAGSAIYNGDEVTIVSSTIANNDASVSGGALYVGLGDTAILSSSIIALNTGGNCVPDGGTIISLGSNLSDDASCLLNPLTDIVNSANIDLGPLMDNGGPTQTLLPALTSDAIGNADCNAIPPEDQRGVSRPQSAGCDIGSVEVQQTTFPLCASYYTGAVTSPLNGGCGAGTVELAIHNSPSFCLHPWTGQVQYFFGRACTPPRMTHTMPDDGDLLTCVSYYTGANRWVRSHAQCTAYEAPNTIPATP